MHLKYIGYIIICQGGSAKNPQGNVNASGNVIWQCERKW